MAEDKNKNELLDEAILLYTQGRPAEAVLALEALVARYPDDIELRDTLNTIKAEVHDLHRDAVNKAETNGTAISQPLTVAGLKELSRKRARIALGIFILLVVLITGLWGFTKVLSSYQNRGTGAYRLGEEKAKQENKGEDQAEEVVVPTPGEEKPTAPTTKEDKTKTKDNTSTTTENPVTVTPVITPDTVPHTTPDTVVTPPPDDTIVPPTPRDTTPKMPGEGYIKVSPSPSTTVYVDGVMIGNSQRIGQVKLKEGFHKITLVSQQYGSRTLNVQVKSDKVTNVSFPF